MQTFEIVDPIAGSVFPPGEPLGFTLVLPLEAAGVGTQPSIVSGGPHW
jgi:hypothetical protein